MGALQEKVDDLRRAVDEATNTVADLISKKNQEIKDLLAAGTLTPEALDAAFQPAIARLKEIGADPDNPVPAA